MYASHYPDFDIRWPLDGRNFTFSEVSPDLASKSKPKPKDIRLEPMTYRRAQNHIRIAANEFRRCYDGIQCSDNFEKRAYFRSLINRVDTRLICVLSFRLYIWATVLPGREDFPWCSFVFCEEKGGLSDFRKKYVLTLVYICFTEDKAGDKLVCVSDRIVFQHSKTSLVMHVN